MKDATRKWLIARLIAGVDGALACVAILLVLWAVSPLFPDDVRDALRALAEAVLS